MVLEFIWETKVTDIDFEESNGYVVVNLVETNMINLFLV
jgi:hypothetical protein